MISAGSFGTVAVYTTPTTHRNCRSGVSRDQPRAQLLRALTLLLALTAQPGFAHGDDEPHEAAPLSTVAVPAQVIANPRGRITLAASQSGIIEISGTGLPQAGQRVKAGERLAGLRPVLVQAERRTLEGDLANASRDTAIGALQIERYGIEEKNFDVKLPTPSLQIISDYRSARARRRELEGALTEPLPITAPRAGRLVRAPAASGRLIAEGETLFELLTDDGLAVEARYADADLEAPETAVAVDADGGEHALRLLGVGYDPTDRRHRALYALVDSDSALAINQRLRLSLPRHASRSADEAR